ncbi:MAG: hypothetical protein WBO97_09160 [Tepidiformaceae bacterium]
MRECPWCGRQNLNVYSYCMRCGRGFDRPEEDEKPRKRNFRFWIFGKNDNEKAA